MNKQGLHERNKHQGHYDIKAMVGANSDLTKHIIVNPHGNETINFADPMAVRVLNETLLKLYYNIDNWKIPEKYLCPPIPGRADYIHHVADLLAECNNGIIPKGSRIKCMDIGTGSSCIYPIIGIHEYDWSFIATETDQKAIQSVENIIQNNSSLQDKIEIRGQNNAKNVFKGVLSPNEKIDITICNPPFHTSYEAAQAGSMRKVKNLSKKKTSKPTLNFGGRSNELWCEGGEKRFIKDMIFESRKVANSCYWFTTLVSKESNLKSVYAVLKQARAVSVKTLPMGQGNKISRVVAWSFYSQKQKDTWRDR